MDLQDSEAWLLLASLTVSYRSSLFCSLLCYPCHCWQPLLWQHCHSHGGNQRDLTYTQGEFWFFCRIFFCRIVKIIRINQHEHKIIRYYTGVTTSCTSYGLQHMRRTQSWFWKKTHSLSNLRQLHISLSYSIHYQATFSFKYTHKKESSQSCHMLVFQLLIHLRCKYHTCSRLAHLFHMCKRHSVHPWSRRILMCVHYIFQMSIGQYPQSSLSPWTLKRILSTERKKNQLNHGI